MHIQITKLKEGYLLSPDWFGKENQVHCYDRADLIHETVNLILTIGEFDMSEAISDLGAAYARIGYDLSAKLKKANKKKGK